MSTPKPPKPAKLIIGLFTSQKELFQIITSELSQKFGAIDMVSKCFPFNYTNYYEEEIGSDLLRRMLLFKDLIAQNSLPEIKCTTNTIEKKYSKDGKRKINIDPGYLIHERFVLATGKNYSHRIYLDNGIYADLTLIYQKNSYVSLPWTYPDYKEDIMINFLEEARNKYKFDLQEKNL
ncbi:MAG: DUF4416 family protein [Desulfobacterales bacterium]|nr:DUF4416 family protein [Desulfobacterales bacterium]